MKAAVYLRVSKDDGSQDAANQEPDCLRVCQARGFDPVFYREEMSGAKVRPKWELVKNAVHRGEVGAVVIWAIDRAGRDRVRLARDLGEIARKGAVTVSVRESWLDQTGPARDLLIEMFAWFADSERQRIRERTLAGQDRARKEGKRIGRPSLPDAKIQGLRVCWRDGCAASSAASLHGLPDSTVRTWFGRFEAEQEAAKSVPNSEGAKSKKTGGK